MTTPKVSPNSEKTANFLTQQPNSVPEIVPPQVDQPVPSPTPETTPSPGNLNTPNATPNAEEPRVLVSEVVVKPETGELTSELEDQVYRVIRTQPGRTTTRISTARRY